MSKRRTRQFSLSTLLLVVTGICLFLGFPHWRRTSILRESNQLKALGFRLLWAGRSSIAFWPAIPKEAVAAVLDRNAGLKVDPGVVRSSSAGHVRGEMTGAAATLVRSRGSRGVREKRDQHVGQALVGRQPLSRGGRKPQLHRFCGEPAGAEGSLKIVTADRPVEVEHFARKVKARHEAALHRS